jgi:hypothetical protein
LNSHGSPVGRAVRLFRRWKEAAPIEGRGLEGKIVMVAAEALAG